MHVLQIQRKNNVVHVRANTHDKLIDLHGKITLKMCPI